jgi:hypothetical protein
MPALRQPALDHLLVDTGMVRDAIERNKPNPAARRTVVHFIAASLNPRTQSAVSCASISASKFSGTWFSSMRRTMVSGAIGASA